MTAPRRTRWLREHHRLMARAFVRSPSGLIGALGVAIVIGTAIIGPALVGDGSSDIDSANAYADPSRENLLGTDQLGRAVFGRTIHATRLTVQLGVTAALVGIAGGVLLGVGAATLGHRGRSVLRETITGSLAIPGVLISVVVVALMGPGGRSAVVGTAIAIMPTTARLVLNLCRQVLGGEYIAAARISGIGERRVLLGHVLPNIAGSLVIPFSLTSAEAIVVISGLSFLGLGVQAPAFDWGSMLTTGLQDVFVNPWAALGPAAAIAFTGFALGLFGEGLARATDPLTWVQRSRETRRRTGRRPPRRRRVDPADPAPTPGVVCRVGGLTVRYEDRQLGQVTAVDAVDLTVAAGEIVAVVGESGSGKTSLALAVAGLIAPPGVAHADVWEMKGSALSTQTERERRRVLATSLGYAFQSARSALNPCLRIGTQVGEPALVHCGLTRAETRRRVLETLGDVDLAHPAEVARSYPLHLSGGMVQRALLATALINDPELIIADEPTSGLDVTTQARILDLLRQLNATRGTSLLLISHDLLSVGGIAHRILVMYAGAIVEELSVEELHGGLAKHPYTVALLACVPTLATEPGGLTTIPGQPPAPGAVAHGCSYASRCDRAIATCLEETPALSEVGEGHRVACWVAAEEARPVAVRSRSRR